MSGGIHMKHFLPVCFVAVTLIQISGCSSVIHPSGEVSRRLSKDILSIVDESVFEVVVLKPVSDSLTYENPLPDRSDSFCDAQ